MSNLTIRDLCRLYGTPVPYSPTVELEVDTPYPCYLFLCHEDGSKDICGYPGRSELMASLAEMYVLHRAYPSEFSYKPYKIIFGAIECPFTITAVDTSFDSEWHVKIQIRGLTMGMFEFRVVISPNWICQVQDL